MMSLGTGLQRCNSIRRLRYGRKGLSWSGYPSLRRSDYLSLNWTGGITSADVKPTYFFICEMHAYSEKSVRACMKLDSEWQHLKYCYKKKSRKCYRNATEWPRPRHACARATFLDLKICSGTRCAHQFSKNSYASSKSHIFTSGDVKPQDIYGGRTRFKYILSAQKNKNKQNKMRAKTYADSSQWLIFSHDFMQYACALKHI